MTAENDHMFLERNRIKSGFLSAFENKKLQYVDPAPLISHEDKSVRFTGASINRFKPMLGTSALVSPGYTTIQPCLRLFSLNTLLKEDTPFHLCYFTMLGTIFHAQVNESAMEWCVSFLHDQCGVSRDRLKIKLSSQYDVMRRVFCSKAQVELDEAPADFYAWKFGMEGVVGRGATFSVLNTFSQKWGDIGNYIELWSPSGLIGSEFSVGLEMTQFHLNSLPGFLHATTIEQVMFEFPGKDSWRLKDTISTLVAMYHGGILSEGEQIPPQTKPGALARKALKNLAILKQQYGIDNSKLEHWLNAFGELEFSRQYASAILSGLEWAEHSISDNTNRFESLLASLLQKIQQGKLSKEDAYETAVKRADGACSLPPLLRDQLLVKAGLTLEDEEGA